MKHLPPELTATLDGAPRETVDLVVRISEDSDQHVSRVQELGFQVRHRFRLLPGLAVTGTVEHIRDLLVEDWVTGIELDQPVGFSEEGTRI